MNIAAIRFTAIESNAGECTGCLLDGQPGGQCPIAWDLAEKAGLPMCLTLAPSGNQYVYVEDQSDPRQMKLIDEAL